jgi:probable addiction module antidote protein
MSKKIKAAVSHHELEVAELRADRELAVEYLKAAMESLDDPDDRAAGLLALRTVAEAYGGLGAVAAEAGISRESLYRTLSANGNPTLQEPKGSGSNCLQQPKLSGFQNQKMKSARLGFLRDVRLLSMQFDTQGETSGSASHYLLSLIHKKTI